MKIATALATPVAVMALVAGVAACGVSAVTPAAHQPTAGASSATATKQASTGFKLSAAQSAAMSNWYSGTTVAKAANVCGDVYKLYFDNVSVNSGTGVSSLQADTLRLQSDAAAALADPPPVRADAVIWKRVLTAFSNSAGDPTNSGLVAAVRMAERAAWGWTPHPGTLLVCLNVSI